MRTRHFSLLLAAALMAAGCNKEPFPDSPFGVVPGGATITATIDDGLTRTELSGNDEDGYDVLWSSGDEFSMLYKYGRYGVYRGHLTYSLVNGAGSTKAVFSTEGTYKSDPPEREVAIYPASMVPDGIEGITSTSISSLVWPGVQTYVQGNVRNCPMYAVADGEDLSFMNMGGILRMTLSGDVKVSRIEVSSSVTMSGDFRLELREGKPVFHFLTSEDHVIDDHVCSSSPSITLDCGTGVTLTEEGVDFSICIPAGSYPDFKVSFYDGDYRLAEKKLNKALVIERSKITAASISGLTQNGRLLKVNKEWTVTPDEIIDYLCAFSSDLETFRVLLPIIINRNLNFASVNYLTEGVDGEYVTASGVIAYPELTYSTETYGRIVSIQHGTCDIDEAPSGQKIVLEMLPAETGIKSDGFLSSSTLFVACMADYLGYGTSRTADLQHPYLNIKLTGKTCADMLNAAGQYIENKGITVTPNPETGSPDIDLLGYSQGGAATIATLLELSSRKGWADRIHEAWAGAGPHDLLCFMDYFLHNGGNFSRSCYIPYTFRGISYAEGLSLDWSNIYHPEIGGIGPARIDDDLFSKTQVSSWVSSLGTDVSKILHPDFFKDDFGGNPDILELVKALEKNSITSLPVPDPAVVSKIKLYHAEGDDTVPYECSELLREAWNCSEVTKIGSPDPQTQKSDHVQAAVSFLLEYCGLGGIL